MATSPRCCTLGRGIVQPDPEIMDQVAKRFAFGDNFTSSSVIQRKMSSKMIQSSILRYITSDRQHLAAENSNSILLRLQYDIRKRIYEFAGLSDGLVINLNYEAPSWLDGGVTTCDSWNELIPLHTRDQDLNRKRNEGFADDDKVSDCEGEVQASEFSERISQFLDGPPPYPGARLYRLQPRCCKNVRNECDCNLHNLLLPSQLLDFCRVVSDEVRYLFYSRNHFDISSTSLGRLSVLHTLKPRFLSWISSLSIELLFCTCTVDSKVSRPRACVIHDADEDRFQGLGIPGQEKLVQQAVTCFKSREMSEWKLFCRNLALYIVPHQLKLWVKVLALNVEIEMAKDIDG
ncbi:hypothetical protein NA56DRAFT_704005 [Hyaloscypha hepaticicola]|uniref:Uncharacterized protein n=1 Tax=Hyaloscypha hepaticicola TaxID=2082293 RepID=A0A2J6Q3C5_9HELO|nr:hypothetical protein NA56DRAFT_704005 [Hyaloscypha hepaticicola]